MSDSDFNIITKHDTAANWTASNPVLLKGQQGFETDTGRSKYGDGVTVWSSLSYIGQLSASLLYNVNFASLPDASAIDAGSIVFISDRGTAGKPAYSDGTNWRFFNDDSVVS